MLEQESNRNRKAALAARCIQCGGPHHGRGFLCSQLCRSRRAKALSMGRAQARGHGGTHGGTNRCAVCGAACGELYPIAPKLADWIAAGNERELAVPESKVVCYQCHGEWTSLANMPLSRAEINARGEALRAQRRMPTREDEPIAVEFLPQAAWWEDV